VWRQSGNGAKFGLKRSANKASAAGAAEGQTYRFRPPFLWFVSFGGTKEPNEVSSAKPNEHRIFGRTKKEQENF